MTRTRVTRCPSARVGSVRDDHRVRFSSRRIKIGEREKERPRASLILGKERVSIGAESFSRLSLFKLSLSLSVCAPKREKIKRDELARTELNSSSWLCARSCDGAYLLFLQRAFVANNKMTNFCPPRKTKEGLSRRGIFKLKYEKRKERPLNYTFTLSI